MSVKQEIIRCTDDDLIAVSNKGIVKRAYKDLEGELSCSVVSEADDMIEVSCGEEQVKIKFPFTDSICSCPSRTICRHVMSAVLFVKKNIPESEQEEAAAACVSEEITDNVSEEINTDTGQEKLTEVSENEIKTEAEIPETREKAQVEDESPENTYKDEMNSLLMEADVEKLQEQLGKLKQLLEELLYVGLSRTSTSAMNSLERFAIVCHNCGLADFESRCRSLKSGYDKYFAHSTAFNEMTQLDKLLEFIDSIEAMEGALKNKDMQLFASIAGTFRNEYRECNDLELVGIATENIKTTNGYEGDVVYFLERNTKEWYTLSDLRPVFYDKASNKRSAYVQSSIWGLNTKVKNLYNCNIVLKNPRCDEKNHLSTSKKSVARLEGKACLSKELIGIYYFDDFSKLYESFAGGENRLFFIAPAQIEEGRYNEIEQKLQMGLWDSKGRRVVLEIKYSKDEEATIRYLENLDRNQSYCFFGRVYAIGGSLCLQPIVMYYADKMFDLPDKKEAD